MFRIRIIPATIAAAMLLLIVKLVDVMHGTEVVSERLLISKVEAQQSPDTAKADAKKADAAPADAKKPDAKAADAKKADAKPADAAADKKPADAAAKGDTKKEDAKADAKPAEGEKGKEGEKGEGEKKAEPKKNPAVSDEPGETVDRRYTAVEVELLQNLSKRREELDRWDKDIQVKEDALGASEKRIDEKIAQIDAMKKEVSVLLAEYNEKEDAKIRSLVKIYEAMKPKDAARIFDETEMPILLLLIDKMAEKKAAPILADMDPKKAKQITVQLAEQRRVSSTKLNMSSATAPPPAAAAPPKTAQP